eukprot:3092134-Karenia_brevis.AAC.1
MGSKSTDYPYVWRFQERVWASSQKMSLGWASVWEAKVSTFRMYGGSRSASVCAISQKMNLECASV